MRPVRADESGVVGLPLCPGPLPKVLAGVVLTVAAGIAVNAPAWLKRQVSADKSRRDALAWEEKVICFALLTVTVPSASFSTRNHFPQLLQTLSQVRLYFTDWPIEMLRNIIERHAREERRLQRLPLVV